MTELNGCAPIKIKVLGPYTFSIGDTTGFNEYVRGGIVTSVKMPKVISHKSYEEAFKNPQFDLIDWAKPDMSNDLHIAFDTLHEFVIQNDRLPTPWNDDDAKAFINIAKSVSQNASFTESLLTTFSKVIFIKNLKDFDWMF